MLGALSLPHPPRFLRIESRRRAAAIAAIGAAIAALGLLLPPPAAERSSRPPSLIDRFLPEYQFSERHQRVIHATPERIFAAVRAVTADEIALFRLLTTVRNPGRLFRKQPAGIFNPSAGRPVLEDAQRSGFVILGESPDREIVLGIYVVRPRGSPLPSPQTFASLAAPGYAKAVMNFRLEPAADGASTLVTETRVLATDPSSARTFAAYWRVIYPGSDLLRRTWLSAIARRAEASP